MSRYPQVGGSEPLNIPVYQYLSTAGDGTGTVEITGDHTVAETFYIEPPAGQVYEIHRLVGFVEDGGTWRAERYGGLAAALTNGISLFFRSDILTDVDLTSGKPIQSNGQWARTCYDSDFTSFGTGNNYLHVRWTFTRAGVPIVLSGDRNEQLSLEVSDNFTGLVGHTFMAQGRRIS